MPRKPRFFVPGLPVHAVQRGHNRSAVFFEDFDYLEYLRRLKQAADEYGCSIHAYVLMSNHVHLLLTPARETSPGRMFQKLGRHYVQYVNSTYRRSGTLWEGRYKGNLIDSRGYLLACMRYIEMNPVRAGMVEHPAQYRWSSYAANALGESNAILSAHAEYLALGNTAASRRAAYRGLFEQPEDGDEQAHLRVALQSGTPLGNAAFRREIEALLQRKVGRMHRGRPTRVGQ